MSSNAWVTCIKINHDHWLAVNQLHQTYTLPAIYNHSHVFLGPSFTISHMHIYIEPSSTTFVLKSCLLNALTPHAIWILYGNKSTFNKKAPLQKWLVFHWLALVATEDSWSLIFPRPSSIVSRVSLENSTLRLLTPGIWSWWVGVSSTYGDRYVANQTLLVPSGKRNEATCITAIAPGFSPTTYHLEQYVHHRHFHS